MMNFVAPLQFMRDPLYDRNRIPDVETVFGIIFRLVKVNSIHLSCPKSFTFLVSANLCTDLTVEYSLTLDLSILTVTGSTFTLVCDEGFSASSPNDSLVCTGQGRWKNKPVCRGKCRGDRVAWNRKGTGH